LPRRGAAISLTLSAALRAVANTLAASLPRTNQDGPLFSLPLTRRRWPLLIALIVSVPARIAWAQVAIETEPSHPARGSLIRLRLTPTVDMLVSEIRGEVAEEPLHLVSADGGLTWTGLAPVPVEGGDSLPITLVLVHSGWEDTVRTAITVEQPGYPSERLTVAPRMAEPDSAGRVRIARDIARARLVSRGAHATTRLWEGRFRLPRASRITSAFGTARKYNGRVTSRHLGTDFNGVVGDPVLATNRGRVALVANFYLAGRVVYLDHGEGLISAYFHLSRALVKTGELVERGQLIGRVGRSGRVTGPHLHWVMRYGGVTVDPMSVVRLTSAEDTQGEKTETGGVKSDK
jgi:Peptidase family M23